MEQQHEEYLSQRQAAARYGISPLTLRRRARDGRLSTYVHPFDDKRMLFRVADLESMRQPRPAQSRTETAATAA